MRHFRGTDVLVTGATGFIGSRLTKALVASGANVHVLARQSSSLDRLRDCLNSISIHQGDVTDRSAVDACVSGANPEIVFHLAADLSARSTQAGFDSVDSNFAVNLDGAINVVRAASGLGTRVRKIVRTGSIGEYGNAPTPFDESIRERPLSAYAASLVAATHFFQAYQAQVGFDLVAVRPALVYGPAQDQRFFIPQLIKSCIDGVDFEMTAGLQKRDFIYIDDVVAGLMVTASVDGLGGAVLNLATGKGYTLS
jgi:Nucleoside-diphosphate-sugar epimerases